MSASSAGHLTPFLARILLIALLGVEIVLAVIALVPLVTAFAGAGGELFGQRVSVLLAGLLAAIWVLVTFVGAIRASGTWPRGSAITIHVLMFAAGTGMLQYVLAPFWMSIAVIALAFVGFFAALLAKPQMRAEG